MKKVLKIIGIVIGALILIFAAVIWYGLYKYKHRKDTHDLQTRIDKICTPYISSGKSVGLFVGIIQGDTVYTKGYGFVDKDSKVTPDSTTIFEIGSITKVFTAEMTQLLVDQNMLNWNDNITKYLPANVKLPTDDGTTLMNLASHTSGFPRLPEMWFKKLEIDTCDPYKVLDTNDLYNYLNKSTDKKKPSLDNFDYSNVGAGLLGHILEWRTAKTYDVLLQEYICKPLQMPNTSTIVTDSTKFATGYDEHGNKTCHWSLPIIQGCGAIKSNGSDMLKFLRANIGGQSAMSASFRKTQKSVAAISGGAIAYGWHVDKLNGAIYGVPEIIWHNGGTGGFRTYIGFIPGTNRGVIVMANQASVDVDWLAIKILIEAKSISLK